jgi:uncharacterized coiled-coil DUF342 family protein
MVSDAQAEVAKLKAERDETHRALRALYDQLGTVIEAATKDPQP